MPFSGNLAKIKEPFVVIHTDIAFEREQDYSIIATDIPVQIIHGNTS
jgi:hypothetical protein